MRTALSAILIAVAVLISTAAIADSDYSVTIGASEYSSDYNYGVSLTLGDSVSDHWFRHNRRGIHVGLNDGNFRAYYNSYPYGQPCYGRTIGGSRTVYYGQTATDSVFSHPNDRGGYRAFIPRGQQGVEYYGDYSTRKQTPVVQFYPNYGHNYCSHGYAYNRCSRCGPTVIQYGAGYYNQPIWSAPAYPEYGYVQQSLSLNPGSEYTDRYYWDAQEQIKQYQQAEQLQVYNDNRTYNNNYYGDNADQGQRSHTPQEPITTPSRSDIEGEPAQLSKDGEALKPSMPSASRFSDSGHVNVGGQEYYFSISDSALFVGPEMGPGRSVADNVDSDFGVFAAYTPHDGVSLIFRRGDRLAAAYPEEDGSIWWVEPLPYEVDFSEKVTTGIVGGSPWVVFNDILGNRHVVQFRSGGWQEMGSGCTAEQQ